MLLLNIATVLQQQAPDLFCDCFIREHNFLTILTQIFTLPCVAGEPGLPDVH